MKKLISLILTICVMASLAICPVSAESADSLNVVYAGNGIFNVTGTVAGAEGAEYKLIMAEYDDLNMFVGATTLLDIAEETFSTTLDFTANDKLSSTLKLMLWDMKNATPVAEAVVNPKGNGGVNVATSDKVIVGGTGSANVGLLGDAANLFDGDDTTWMGFYASRGETGYMYIDLQDYYEIDRIEVLSYSNAPELNSAGARGTEYDVVLGNEVPDGTAFDEENPNGEFKAAYVDFDERAKDINVGYKTIYVPENAGEFRFVSLEKWQEGRAGLLVYGIKVYVKEENIPTYVNVAQGKNVGGTGIGGGNTGLISSTSLVDGDETNSAGFYASVGTAGYMYIDLGEKYNISSIEVLAYNSSYVERAGNFDIIVGNDIPDGSAFDAEKEVKVAFVAQDSNATSASVGYKKFVLPNDGNKYRYVSFEKLVADGIGLLINEVKVNVAEDEMPTYVNVARNKYAGGSVSSAGNIGLYSTDSTGYLIATTSRAADRLVDGDSATGAGFMVGANTKGNMFVDLGAEYKIHHINVLSYNHNNADRADKYTVVLSNAVQNGITSPDANKYEFPQVTGATTSDATTAQYRTFYNTGNDEKYRFVSVEKFVDGAGLNVAEIEVYVEKEEAENVIIPEYVEVAKNKAVGSAVLSGGTVISAQTVANINDGNDATSGWFFGNAGKSGCMYVDLGAACEIEYIEVLSYAGTYTRAGKFDIVASKKTPDAVAYADGNGELKVARANDDSQAVASNVGYKRYYMPENSGKYRYVSIEKFDDVGLYVAEIKVYVKPENVPVPSTNVALGKTGVLRPFGENSASHGLASATDGVLSSVDGKYICTNLNVDEVYTIDLGMSYDIDKILIDCNIASCTDGVAVYLADAPYTDETGLPANRTTVIEATEDKWATATKEVSLAEPVKAQYVIVYRTAEGASYGHFRLGELEVWGK